MSNVIKATAFMHTASKTQSALAAKLAGEIKDLIHTYDDQIPLALAIGVIRIVERELIDDHA